MLVNAKAHMPFHLPRNKLVGHELGSHGLQLRAGFYPARETALLPTRSSPNLPLTTIEALFDCR